MSNSIFLTAASLTFSALKSILAKQNYHLTDCDTDEEVTLEHIFRSVI